MDAHGLAISLAALGEPILEGLRKAFRLDTQPNFDSAVGEGQCVVKFGRAGEIPHGETIEPIERARPLFTVHNHVDLKLLRKHRAKRKYRTLVVLRLCNVGIPPPWKQVYMSETG